MEVSSPTIVRRGMGAAGCGLRWPDLRGHQGYHLRTAVEVVTIILTLLGRGCPLQAIVAAFGFDERTIAKWRVRAGYHCQGVHRHLVQKGAVDLQHVQADELWVKMVGRRVWMAMAIDAPSRLWVGGVISPRRDLVLITALVEMIRSCAFLRVFRKPVRTGRKGRPRLVLERGLLLGQVVKQYSQRRVVSVSQRIVRGTPAAIAAALVASAGGHGINTSVIERLNATPFGVPLLHWYDVVGPSLAKRRC
ncbi:MAG: hypothetical protein Q8P59_11900 [Dehalococcoidia bacterium]|nr:hypothetical protein [Dehalococcoidia bacterium]